MLEAGSRKRNQPAPPHVMFEALTRPDRDPARPWLELLDDEQRPRLVEVSKPGLVVWSSLSGPRCLVLVVWSSLWIKRPDAIVRFDLPPDSSGYGTDLRWTLLRSASSLLSPWPALAPRADESGPLAASDQSCPPRQPPAVCSSS
jgi:hypothetical protein